MTGTTQGTTTPDRGGRGPGRGAPRWVGRTVLLALLIEAGPALSGAVPEAPAGAPSPSAQAVGDGTGCRPGEIPAVSLEGMEPLVVEQLGGLAERLRSEDRQGGVRAETWAEAGVLYHAYSLLPAAICCYRAALGLAPDELSNRYRLAVALEEANQPAAATAELVAVLSGPDLYVPAMVRLAALSLAAGDAEVAEEVLAPALGSPSPAAAVLALGGEVALARGQPELAVRRLEAALAREPRATRLHYPLALAWRNLGDPERAAEYLARVGRSGVRPADPWLDVLAVRRVGTASAFVAGHTAFRAGDFAAAREQFALAWEGSGRTDRGALVNMAAAESALGDLAAARQHFEEAVRLDPGDGNARFNLGLLELELGRPEAARPLLAPLAAAGDREAAALLAAAELRLGGAERAMLLLAAGEGPLGEAGCRQLTTALAAAALPPGPLAERLQARRAVLCPQP
jgi:tetratricopeptide (TPR) repeat protein